MQVVTEGVQVQAGIHVVCQDKDLDVLRCNALETQA